MDKEGSMDLSGAFAKLLENPEALKSALGIASALKDSGAFEGLSKATGEEYKGEEHAYNEQNAHEKTQRAPFVPSGERSSAPVGDDGKRRKQLLMALLSLYERRKAGKNRHDAADPAASGACIQVGVFDPGNQGLLLSVF